MRGRPSRTSSASLIALTGAPDATSPAGQLLRCACRKPRPSHATRMKSRHPRAEMSPAHECRARLRAWLAIESRASARAAGSEAVTVFRVAEAEIGESLGNRGRHRQAAGAGRPVAVPVLAKLVIKDTTSASRLWLAAAWRRCRPAAGCPPAVSAPDGHGMILAGKCVDLEDTTYRVILAGVGP